MERLKFDEIFQDDTKLGIKIQASEYLGSGKYPIIDQSHNAVAGYTNEQEGIFEDVPVIVFGDHTRVIKYVDNPFFLGADGIKILHSKLPNTNYKYLYYALKNAHIPDTGYNRHFKWLREVEIKYPSAELQARIVSVLDGLSTVLVQRKQQLDYLDTLVKARFVEMFGDTFRNLKNLPILSWNDVFNATTGKLDSNASTEAGKYPFFTCSKEVLRIDKYAFDQEALLLAGNNAAGKYDVKHYKGKFNAYQRTYVLSLKQNWSYELFKYQLEDKLDYLQQQSLGGLTKYLTMKILRELNFLIPDNNDQKEFTDFVHRVDKSKVI
ncbi:restriction endonuclease subunit S [Alloscardovia venturai]|uniref:Restriction endonuclease subunit S n=1 Tax=Alloscardovia venturai TaxID=1769421 RepID=A0ABW2Y9D9_9BIFI